MVFLFIHYIMYLYAYMLVKCSICLSRVILMILFNWYLIITKSILVRNHIVIILGTRAHTRTKYNMTKCRVGDENVVFEISKTIESLAAIGQFVNNRSREPPSRTTCRHTFYMILCTICCSLVQWEVSRVRCSVQLRGRWDGWRRLYPPNIFFFQFFFPTDDYRNVYANIYAQWPAMDARARANRYNSVCKFWNKNPSRYNIYYINTRLCCFPLRNNL